MHIQLLPIEVATQIVSYVIHDQISHGNGPNIASVCTKWKTIIEEDFLWKPLHQDIFSSRDYHIVRITYPHDIPKGASMKEQVRIATGMIKKMNIDGDQHLTDLLNIKCKVINNRNTNIHKVSFSINPNLKLESIAIALLFNPVINANVIAKQLFDRCMSEEIPDAKFIIEVLIKLHYDLTSFFSGLNDIQKEMVISFVIGSELDITLSDYKQSGCKFSLLERNTSASNSNYSFLFTSLRIALNCYSKEGFSLKVIREIFEPSSFKDKRLMCLKRKQPFSENDLIQFLRDLIFNCNLNLDIKMSSKEMSVIPEGSAISSFRWITHNCPFLPKKNAFKVVLDEYQHQQKLQTIDDKIKKLAI